MFRAIFITAVVGVWGCGGPAFQMGEDPTSGNTPDGASTATGTDVPVAQTKAQGGCESARAGSASFDNEICFRAAAFSMGSNLPNLGNAFADHTPAHTVRLSMFLLDAYEVTVGRYRACVEAGGCLPPEQSVVKGCSYADTPENDALPVTCATWTEARNFCQWDGGRRLPTEAEWEYAARGSDGLSYPWGDTFACSHAVIGGYQTGPCPENAGPFPRRVGAIGGQSQMGVFDLIGNAAEWVSDWVGSYDTAVTKDPKGPDVGAERVLRGGSWASTIPMGLGFARSTAPPETHGPWGFRCARTP